MPRAQAPGRPAGQYTQAVRLFQLFHRLDASPEGVHVDALAHEFGVTPRSIRRDLTALRNADQPLESLKVDGEKRVRLARTGRTSEPIRMTRFQRYSLAAARRAFDVLAGTPLHDDLSQLFSKLVPETTEGNSLMDRFVFIPEAPKSYRKFKDQIYEIYDGILRNLTLSFTYDAGSTPGVRKVEPYALVLYRNGLYVVGIDVAKKASRTFAVERMRRVHALVQAPFERDPKFVVERLFDGAFGISAGGPLEDVVVDFEQRVATYVRERAWHPSQKIVNLDVGIRCQMRVAVSEELVAWVLRWGATARVVSPPALVERIRSEHERAAAQYRRGHDAAAGTS